MQRHVRLKKARGQRSLSSIPLWGYWGPWGSSETSTSVQNPRPDVAPQAELSPSQTGQHSLVLSPSELAHGRGNWDKHIPMSCSRTTDAQVILMMNSTSSRNSCWQDALNSPLAKMNKSSAKCATWQPINCKPPPLSTSLSHQAKSAVLSLLTELG